MEIRSRFSRRKNRRPLVHKIILLVLSVLLIAALSVAITLYRYIFRPNVSMPSGDTFSLYIPSNSNFEVVSEILYNNSLIINKKSFEWVAERKNYPGQIKPGHYILTPGMSNNTLVNLLRSGAQVPVRVVFNNIRLLEELAQKLSSQLEPDSADFIRCWNDTGFVEKLGINREHLPMIFVPNTYEAWWNTDACEFTLKMHGEFLAFWSGERTAKAKSIGLSIPETVILASIVEKETRMNDEKAAIAGVYLNRLRKGWPLQADPTLVFASGDYGLKRVLNVHKKIDSPYNTYKYKDLPPGPICLPSIASVDAVLNATAHDYMFFCARDDLSGYHVFSRTLREHNRHAARYQKAISRRNS